jgi:hypothetical protein
MLCFGIHKKNDGESIKGKKRKNVKEVGGLFNIVDAIFIFLSC